MITSSPGSIRASSRVKNRMLAPDRRDHFIPFSLHTEVFAISAQDGIPKRGNTDCGSVAGEICVDRPLGGFLDILRAY